MNKKTIKSMIILIGIFLIAWYVLKFFFPQEFVLTINNEKIILVGKYIDSHLWLNFLCSGITSFITYYLFLGAVCKILKFNWQHYIAIITSILGSFIVYYLLPELVAYYSIYAMIIMSAIFKGEIRTTAIVLCFHSFCQLISLNIRGLSCYIISFDFASAFIMTIESYFWLLLFYIYFNFKERIL